MAYLCGERVSGADRVAGNYFFESSLMNYFAISWALTFENLCQGDHVVSGGQPEWAAEDAAQHALNLANWRIKLLQVRATWVGLCVCASLESH